MFKPGTIMQAKEAVDIATVAKHSCPICSVCLLRSSMYVMCVEQCGSNFPESLKGKVLGKILGDK